MASTPQAPNLPSAAEICSKTQDVFGKTPCLFQIELCLAQLQAQYNNQDIISIAPTGSGKTMCFLMPLLFTNKITIIVTALNLLGEQFSRQVEDIGISAVAVTAANNSRETFQSIQDGIHRVVLISPELLVQRDGWCKNLLWSNKGFMSKVFNLVFDEGHCISQWGSTFRPEYKLVGMLRFIAPGIPFYITSATIPHRMLQDIKETLHIPSSSLLFQRSNDRHNIAFSVKKMQYPMSSFEDLAFLVPSSWAEHDSMPRKFMVFFDSKREAESASTFLRNRMPDALKHKVKWFHAGMTEFFRKEELQSFKEGNLWGLGMTDVGGMGVDVPDVLTVVQWRAPKDLNTLMQRFGRAGRDFSLQAVAILLAEPKWFLEDHQKKLARKRKRTEKRKKKVLRPRASITGARTSDVSSSENESVLEGETSLNAGNKNKSLPDSDGEGASDIEEAIKTISITAGGTGRGSKRTTDKVMRMFINAHLLHGRKCCRRFHINHYYRTASIPQPPPCCNRCMPKVPSICCDICHPDLVHTMINDRDDDYQVVPRGSTLPKRPAHALTQRASRFRDALYDWRTETATGLFGALDFWPADLFMHKEIVEDIVIFVDTNKIVTVQDLRKTTNWIHCDQYGNQIISLIQRFFPPALPPNLFVSTPIPLRMHQTGATPFSNVLNSPPRLSSSGSAIRKLRAPSTCTACFQKGHRKNALICPARTQRAQRGDENTAPVV